jgi:hypothetical protein
VKYKDAVLVKGRFYTFFALSVGAAGPTLTNVIKSAVFSAEGINNKVVHNILL